MGASKTVGRFGGRSGRCGLLVVPACSAFTLMELLVVIAVIAVLVSLLLPAISYGKFQARVATCSNNYRQWAVAVALYATEDGKGRLPSYPLPVDKMVQYRSLEPWFVPFALVTNMAMQGVTVPMWFCPLRAERFEIHRENFRRLTGRDLATPADLVQESEKVQGAAFAGPDLFWWVPRRLGQSSLEFPDPKLMKTRVPDPWPSRMDDPTVSIMPFLSDDTVRKRLSSGFVVTGGGHRWGGSLKNNNAAYVDGHVETRSAKQLQWQAESPTGLIYLY
jgi:prepilin-type N-terminal cleavage/methylation domain-containing protein/prepilin-type processing-associated H-X9-DG protein